MVTKMYIMTKQLNIENTNMCVQTQYYDNAITLFHAIDIICTTYVMHEKKIKKYKSNSFGYIGN